MAKIFFSYSHRDEELRDELEKHLSLLKRQGVIETWHDRRITPGDDFAGEIDENLENSQIVLLLVSSDFLASDYCYEIEMTRALDRHGAGEARVIPIIVRPCHWNDSPFGHLQALPTDAKPVTRWSDLDEAFLDITHGIRRALNEMPQSQEPAAPTAEAAPARPAHSNPPPRSSNLRIRQEFTDRDRDTFLEEAYGFIAAFFERSLAELQFRNPGIETTYKQIDTRHFSATIYRNGDREAGCRIWLAGRDHFSGGIAFAHSDTGNDSSFNESLNVDDDGQTQFLRTLGLQSYTSHEKPKLTHQGAAEHLWGIFIGPLQP